MSPILMTTYVLSVVLSISLMTYGLIKEGESLKYKQVQEKRIEDLHAQIKELEAKQL